MDREVQAAIAELFSGVTSPPPAEGDWIARREQSEGFYTNMFNARFGPLVGRQSQVTISVSDGQTLDLMLHEPADGGVARNVVYFHGGGFIAGSPVTHAAWCDWLAQETGSRVVSVAYRLAPEAPAPIPQEDCYAACLWVAENLSGQPERRPLIVAGDSSGAGLAASVSIMARDRRDPVIDGQLLIQPMLDDRPHPPKDWKVPFLMWSVEDNNTAWAALLGDRRGTDRVPPYVAAARENDLSGLPFTYLEICELDLFFEEGLEYLQRLVASDVRVDAHVLPGVPHAFDVLAPQADISRRSVEARCAFLRSFRPE